MVQAFAKVRFLCEGCAADLNGDDRVDLAVTNRLSDSVSVLLGDGLGAFS